MAAQRDAGAAEGEDLERVAEEAGGGRRNQVVEKAGVLGMAGSDGRVVADLSRVGGKGRESAGGSGRESVNERVQKTIERECAPLTPLNLCSLASQLLTSPFPPSIAPHSFASPAQPRTAPRCQRPAQRFPRGWG